MLHNNYQFGEPLFGCQHGHGEDFQCQYGRVEEIRAEQTMVNVEGHGHREFQRVWGKGKKKKNRR